MNYSTQPVFIIGSGRCGTRSLYKIFNRIENIKAYHEYLCEVVQKEACKKMMGLKTKKESIKFIEQIFKTAINYENKDFWIDCSNKLSWFIPELKEVFPESKFVLLLRDGRKVSSSFFNKLKPEIYNDNAVNVLENWMQDRTNIEPPTEKPYWWILPKYYNILEDCSDYNQFQKICWHWKSINSYVISNFNKMQDKDYNIIKLEELVNSKLKQKELFDFIGIEFKDTYSKMLSRPENVFVPYDFKLTKEQSRQFHEICNEIMLKLEYKGEEYDVRY